MKHLKIVSALLILVLTAACRHANDPTDVPALPVEEWMQQDPAACATHYNRQYGKFARMQRLDSLATIYRRVLCLVPERPAGDADTVRYKIGSLVCNYALVSIQSDGTGDAIHLLDSLRTSAHPFYRDEVRYTLNAELAYLCMFHRDADRALAYADAYWELREGDEPRTHPATVSACLQSVATVYAQIGDEHNRVEPLLTSALAVFRRSGKGSEVMGRLSIYYRHKGDYARAIDLQHESAGWYETHPGMGQPRAGVIAYGDLVNLYYLMEQPAAALATNRRAIDLTAPTDSDMMGNLYRMRTAYLEKMQPMNLDSVLACNRTALQYDIPNEEDYQRNRIRRMGLLTDYVPDSAAYALAAFRQMYADSAYHRQPSTLSYLQRMFASALSKGGHPAEAVPLYEQAYRTYGATHKDTERREVAHELMGIYSRQGMTDRLAALFPAYAALTDSLTKEDMLRYTAASQVRYETGRKEQENRALTAEVRLKERTLVLMWLIVALAATLLVAAAVYILHRRRNYRRRLAAHQEELTRLLDEQEQLNTRNETLVRTLSTLKRQERTDHADIVAEAIGNINPSPLSDEREVRFRRSFNALHPRFLKELHRLCPALTKTDELLCMLIALGKDTKEISLVMGIAKESVLTSRSRVRKKLGMEKDDSLEEVVGKIRKR